MTTSMKKRRIFKFGMIVFSLLIVAGFFVAQKAVEQPIPVAAPKKSTTIKPQIKNTSVIINGTKINISWVLDKTPLPYCPVLEAGFARACYSEETNTIYISQEIKDQKDFIFYHEIGHAIYKQNFPKDLFKETYFGPDYETLANNFAWYIYGKKYPEKQSFVNETVSAKKLDYFSQTCNAACIRTILKII